MKVAGPGLHDPCVQVSFAEVYEAWFHEVTRWARSLGGPDADLDDLTQDVFLIVRRKLPSFDGRNLPGWLYRITARTVRDHRRSAWLRRAIFGRREEVLATPHPGNGPAEEAERHEAQRQLQRLLSKMSDKHSSALVLFEIEGYTGEEIATLQGIPVATVWTRLHHARKELLALCQKLEQDPRAAKERR